MHKCPKCSCASIPDLMVWIGSLSYKTYSQKPPSISSPCAAPFPSSQVHQHIQPQPDLPPTATRSPPPLICGHQIVPKASGSSLGGRPTAAAAGAVVPPGQRGGRFAALHCSIMCKPRRCGLRSISVLQLSTGRVKTRCRPWATLASDPTMARPVSVLLQWHSRPRGTRFG
jgi:hypothetical protein